MFEHDFPFPLGGFQVSSLQGRYPLFDTHFWYSKKWCFPQQNIHHEEFLPPELPVLLVVRLAIRVHHPPGSSLAILTPALPNPRCSVEKDPVDLDFLLPTWTQQPWGVNIRSTLTYSSYFKVFFPLTSHQRKHLDHFMFPKCRTFCSLLCRSAGRFMFCCKPSRPAAIKPAMTSGCKERSNKNHPSVNVCSGCQLPVKF